MEAHGDMMKSAYGGKEQSHVRHTDHECQHSPASVNVTKRLGLKVQYVVVRTKLSKQTGLEGQHNFILIYFVHVWRTLPLF